MSKKYPGGFITKDYVAPTPSSAKGVWTLDQQMQAQKTGTWPFGGPFNYIEDVFSTYLYTGTGAAQTINNDIDLAGKGGLVWLKSRSLAENNMVFDTARGVTQRLFTDNTNGQSSSATSLTAFNSNGFSISSGSYLNTNAATYASWTFRKQPKFFDVVTWTGDGTSTKTVAHNLQARAACIFIKKTSGAADWMTFHLKSDGAGATLNLNTTAGGPAYGYSVGTADTVNNATNVPVGFLSSAFGMDTNTNGATYVAYMWASNAGGFGESGTDNVVSCGSFTTDGSGNATVSLGYEPQWLMVKASSAVQSWYIEDNMRAFNLTSRAILFPNLSNAEATGASAYLAPNSTGFAAVNGQLNASTTYIYIAIRRGPMKVPTDATKVFSPIATSIGSGKLTTGFPVDAQFMFYRTGGLSTRVATRLTGVATLPVNGVGNYLQTASTAAEVSGSSSTRYWDNTGFEMPSDWGSSSMIFESFQRAPGFFDEVCYTGNGGYVSRNHNLAAVPEMMIVKARSTAGYNWAVYVSTLGFESYMRLNTAGAPSTTGNFWYQTPTATQFSTGAYADIEEVGVTYVNYLFATCAGVSKVGSYTGTGATQTIACGFTAGARFVLIKRTDSTGDWYVWDSARGMVSGTDPSLLLNSTAAEVNANSIYAITTGFQIVSTAAGINANGGSYIFLAIA